jgi:predicted PurR-regulated permease PerM
MGAFLYPIEEEWQEYIIVSERAKVGVICVLLLLVLGYVAFSAVNTVQAVRNFQQQYNNTKTGNVNTIRPWMTLHAISLIYHVPKEYLYGKLNLTDTTTSRRSTLYTIASSKRQPVDKLIRTIQVVILTYRKEHPGEHPIPVPSVPPKRTSKSRVPHPLTKYQEAPY